MTLKKRHQRRSDKIIATVDSFSSSELHKFIYSNKILARGLGLGGDGTFTTDTIISI